MLMQAFSLVVSAWLCLVSGDLSGERVVVDVFFGLIKSAGLGSMWSVTEIRFRWILKNAKTYW